eukprot:CAMPEP_0197660518 /NCGR_PEP_ID=MMETSP1338-20131121/50890_1 /TAXON_ID=43686 ORGANISM="Pelagodinium beii, Strain RCC1491" /NCGR_SAMPLE_ID=MMETSP1338 /ASSEMBLY_ACC=CAM_ASM_000754 /LENGTH=341 /DNA_ID=CAMNT_0043237879 /DNA_START=59 /DNA_END=1084 /DNA_ORIENTATION=+
MADPNGREASKQFLEENKGKEGVITLTSGLQYKVLKEGSGMEHPKVSTPCECHYAGRLLDGTEFDSSYKRGAPSTFAPNQVIKGWTEAMQLMVQGDKWEMYIPMELAYGPNGKPPKIPPAAALIFIMEIVKIKGETVAKQIVFPDWTAEQLALWTEKDQAACEKWRDAKVKSWEEGKLRDLHESKEAFDAWLDKQCLSSKNKSLWKRTRKKESDDDKSGGYAKAETPAGPPQLTKESARSLLTKALETFKQPANKEKLLGILDECKDMDPSQAGMAKMMKLMPAVQSMMEGTMKEFGFSANDLMMVVMQIQAFSSTDPSIATDIGKLMKAVQGDLTDLLES